MEKMTSSEKIYDGKVIKVRKDQVLMDDGHLAYREVVHHNGGACIALKDGNYYYLVKQYRYALGKTMLEFPAGKIEIGENPDDTILREAIEETGYSVQNLRKLGYCIPTCGYDDEIIYLYYGEVKEFKGQHFDVDERIVLEKYTFAQLKDLIKQQIINDSKTIALVLRIQLEGLDD